MITVGRCASEACSKFDYWHYPVLMKDWYKDWPSFHWELPLFWWFLGLGVVLGVACALLLHVMHKKRRVELLLWTAHGGAQRE